MGDQPRKSGEVPIRLPNGNTMTLHQVRHVPDLKRSLISFGMPTEDGYKTTLIESSWHIAKGNLYIDHGVRYNNLYPLNVVNSREVSLNIAILPTLSLWHSQLDHMSQVGLNDFWKSTTS